MLLKQSTLAGIAAGTITIVYRRWPRPHVRAGSTFRTPVGVLRVVRIEPSTSAAVTERDARRAGHASRATLLAELGRYGSGRLYRIALRVVGPDPRLALRERARLTKEDLTAIDRKLARFDAAGGPTASTILQRIGTHPGVRAADLAAGFGMATPAFKVRVRRLKELGLTESLEVGYRLSPRGRALLRRIAESP